MLYDGTQGMRLQLPSDQKQDYKGKETRIANFIIKIMELAILVSLSFLFRIPEANDQKMARRLSLHQERLTVLYINTFLQVVAVNLSAINGIHLIVIHASLRRYRVNTRDTCRCGVKRSIIG